jgi:hypothetical protein
LYLYILYITLLLGIIPLCIHFIKDKILWNHNGIIPFIWLTAFASVYEWLGTLVLKFNSVYWFQIYPVLSALAILYFFWKVLSSRRLTLIKFLLITFILVYCTSFFFVKNDIFVSSSLNRIAISATVFILTIIWFKELFDGLNKIESYKIKDGTYLWESENFYFVAGIFIYYCTTFFLFLSSSLIYKSELYFNDYWFVNIIATLILRLFLIISAWKMSKA